MSRQQPRAPGSFSPLPGGSSTTNSNRHNNTASPGGSSSSGANQPSSQGRPSLSSRRVESPDSDNERGRDRDRERPSITISRTRPPTSPPVTPIYTQFTSQPNSSTSSLHQNFSRPAGSRLAAHGATSPLLKNHSRKHSATQGMFDSSLPSTNTSNLSSVGLNQPSGHANQSSSGLSASQIAAQAAVMSHQQQQQQQQQLQQQSLRSRSQTVPFPGDANESVRRGSGSKGPISPPVLSLTEASAPRESGFGSHSSTPQQDRLASASHSSAATAAANVVFPRSGHSSPNLPSAPQLQPPPAPPLPPPPPEKMSKSEKAKAKLFSRPAKISTKAEPKEKPLPSPSKLGNALSALQRGNFSTTSLVEPGNQSLYNHANSSAATIRPVETPTEDKGKEKKHHFLSRQKNKLKEDFHLPLSSAASNSLPTDPNAPSSLYNFNLPQSPGPSSSSFAKAKKEKKLAERSESRLGEEASFLGQSEWPGAASVTNLSQQSTVYDFVDPAKLGMTSQLSLDDAWPFLKAKLLVIFEGEDLRLTVEDFNRVVQMHIKYCIQRRNPAGMLDDLREFLAVGFSSLDRSMRKTPEDRCIPALVELWLFTFTSILPYIQAVFLPLDMEVSGCGTIMSPEQARDFWGGVVASPSSSDRPARVTPASAVLDVRRLVLIAYRDIVILPRYETLKSMFSRLSLEFLPSSFANPAMSSPIPDANPSTSPPEFFPIAPRPGTAMSLDPSVASYNSTSTTLLGDGSGGSAGGRSRAISNVSFGSHGSDSAMRPFTPSGLPTLGSVREQNVEDSKQVTDMVGRMLQCMSVLSSLGGAVGVDDEGNRKMVELCKMLKLNWLGRGRTGRNRMGIVGGRVKREGTREELRVA